MVSLLIAVLSVGQVIFISPSGNDGASGGESSPMRTIEAAMVALKGVPQAKIEVLAGDYILPNMVSIGKDYAGLTIEGRSGANPTFYGGIEVKGWIEDGKLLSASIPDPVAVNGARMLMVEGQLRPRSRMPAAGEFKHESVFDVPWMSTTGGGWKRKPTDVELTTMKAKPSDIGPWLEPASAEVTVYHMWDESCVGVASVDLSSGGIRFSSPCGHPPGAFAVQKYVVWNTKQGLTKPGQWFLDRKAKRIYYWPLPGENPKNLKAYLPTLNVLFGLVDAQGVTLKNLNFKVANVSLKAGGFGAGAYDGAITAATSSHLRLENISVQSVAGTGIKLWNCPDASVENCRASDTGAGGIRVEGDRSVVEDCFVSHVGIQYPSAIGLWVGGRDAICSHNEVTDTSYSAILGAGEGHLISDNYIARAMLTMHDGGGIYFGFSGHVTVRNNLVEDIIDTGLYGASAYYLDEQAHDCVVEGNVSIGITRPSQNHMARHNTIQGNLFLNSSDMRMDFARCTDYTIRNNVLDSPGSLNLRLSPDGASSIAANVFGGSKGVSRVTLNQYAEVSTNPLEKALNWFDRPRITQQKKRVWKVIGPDSRARVWDMSQVGPRSKSKG